MKDTFIYGVYLANKDPKHREVISRTKHKIRLQLQADNREGGHECEKNPDKSDHIQYISG